MSACPNQPPNHDLEPFIVEAKVLRPGALPPPKARKPIRPALVVSWIESILVLPFTAVAFPLALVGFAYGAISLPFTVSALVFLIPAAAGLWGLLALWSLLLGKPEDFTASVKLRRFAFGGACAGILLDSFFLMAYGTKQPLWTFVIASPAAVAVHRVLQVAMAMGWFGGERPKQ